MLLLWDALLATATTIFAAGTSGAVAALRLRELKAAAVRAKATNAPDYKAKKHAVYDAERALKRAISDHNAGLYDASNPRHSLSVSTEGAEDGTSGSPSPNRRISLHTGLI